MTDYTELKRLAKGCRDEVIRSHGWAGMIEAADLLGRDEIFLKECSPEVVLALIAENEALRKDAERWRFFSVLANDLQAFPHSWGQMTPEKMDFMCDEAMAAAMSKEPQP